MLLSPTSRLRLPSEFSGEVRALTFSGVAREEGMLDAAAAEALLTVTSLGSCEPATNKKRTDTHLETRCPLK